jgi:hypothetical protein
MSALQPCKNPPCRGNEVSVQILTEYTSSLSFRHATEPASRIFRCLSPRHGEDYDDFSPSAIGGERGMKRLISKTETYDVLGQSPQTTTFTYVQSPIIAHHMEVTSYNPTTHVTTYRSVPASAENPAIHGRLNGVSPRGLTL